MDAINRSGNRFSSKGEKEVRSFIESLGFKTKTKKIYCKIIKKYREIDIFISELNIGIEYNGLYWHSEANPKIYPKYHLEKTELCKKNGIRLIQIFEHEWRDRKDQVKSFLRSALNKNENFIYARKCDIRQVSKEETKQFLNNYHIQGNCPHTTSYGLYYNNELLALVTIGKHHRNSTEIVLSRFVGKNN